MGFFDHSDPLYVEHLPTRETAKDTAKLDGVEVNAIRSFAADVRTEVLAARGRDTALDGRVTTLESLPARVTALEDADLDARVTAQEGRVSGWYVDSVNGNDANAGTASDAPLQTIAALLGKTIAEGSTIYLARGSHFREMLSGLPDLCRVVAYGQGARPLLDCSDTAVNASFTKTAGRTNVYQIAWSHSFNDVDKSRHSVWENGVRLTRAADLATCDATPGSFYAATPTLTGPDTVYVHPTGSTNPVSDGKTYDLAKRPQGFIGSAFSHAEGLHTRRNGHNNGSLGSYSAKDCLAEDGTFHNMWVTALAEDCVAWKNEGYEAAGSSTMFISYEDADGKGALYRRCKALGSNQSGTIGFYAHTVGSGPKFSRVVYEDCEAVNVSAGFAVADARVAVYRNCKTYRVAQAISSAADETYVLGGTLNGWTYSTPAMSRAVSGDTPKLVMRGVRIISRVVSGGLVWVSGAVDIQRCTLVIVDAAGFPFTMIRVDTGSLVAKHNVVWGVGGSYLYELGAAVTLDSDYNVFFPADAIMQTGGVADANLAAYVARVAPVDANSAIGDPVFIGQLRNGDTRVGNTSPAWTPQAGADYEGEDDLALHDAFYEQSAA